MFSNYWILWPVGIIVWLASGWAVFGIFETKALKSTDPSKPTLSRFIYTLSTRFPLAMALGCAAVGMFFGILWTHFYWHWCPIGSVSAG